MHVPFVTLYPQVLAIISIIGSATANLSSASDWMVVISVVTLLRMAPMQDPMRGNSGLSNFKL